MKDRGETQITLNANGICIGNALSYGAPLRTESVDKLCKCFNCQPWDIMDIGEDRNKVDGREEYNSHKKSFQKLWDKLDALPRGGKAALLKQLHLSKNFFDSAKERNSSFNYANLVAIAKALDCDVTDLYEVIDD